MKLCSVLPLALAVILAPIRSSAQQSLLASYEAHLASEAFLKSLTQAELVGASNTWDGSAAEVGGMEQGVWIKHIPIKARCSDSQGASPIIEERA